MCLDSRGAGVARQRFSPRHHPTEHASWRHYAWRLTGILTRARAAANQTERRVKHREKKTISMSQAGEVASAADERARGGPLSNRVAKASKLHQLLHHLAGSASRVMGNQQAAAPAPPANQEQRPSLPNSKSFQWSVGPLETVRPREDPPECLIKLAKVL